MQFPSLVLALIDLLRRFFYFMEYWKITSLENLQEIYEGVLYIEEWRPIPGYEGIYEVSSFGRIKGLRRAFDSSYGNRKRTGYTKERIIKSHPANGHGYIHVKLSVGGVNKIHKVHRLVAFAFLGKCRLHVDHKDERRTHNAVWNLQYLSHRDNIKKSTKPRDIPMGVSYSENGKRFAARIKKDGKMYNLGVFDTVKEAKDRYEFATDNLDLVESIAVKFKKSPYGGGIDRDHNRFRVRVTLNGERVVVGYTATSEEAVIIRDEFKQKHGLK